MKGEDIIELFKRFEQEATRINDVECWSARGLCPLLGYADWRNFLKAIEKAKESCINAGEKMSLEKALQACKKERIDDITLIQYVSLMSQLGATA